MGKGKLEVRLPEIPGYRHEQGLLWPDYDTRCAEVTFRECAMMLTSMLPYVTRRGTVVQAGGNCGQLVRHLAKLFGAVYTFEPDPRNFLALAINTAPFPNVFRYQAALGEPLTEPRGMANGDHHFPGANCGALYMTGAGEIPTLSIDALALTSCDLIFLDIEGSERQALRGAARTLDRCRPIVVLEDKGLGSEFYGELPGAAERLLQDRHGYQRLAKIRHDYIFGPIEPTGAFHESADPQQSESRQSLL